MQVKKYGKDNDLIERIKKSKDFELVRDKIDEMLEPSKFIGRSKEQVEEFISEDIDPILQKYDISKEAKELNV
jgi:adenylosuccinate lyase